MRIVRPLIIDDTVLTVSNIPASAYAVYSASATYNIADKVFYQNYEYECQTDGTIGISPDSGSANWISIGVANPFAMFDEKLATQTELANEITCTLGPVSIQNTLAFLNVDAQSIQVIATDATEGEVYNRTASMVDLGVTNVYEYLFEPVKFKYSLILTDLPPYPNLVIDIVISKANSIAKVGAIILGSKRVIGQLEYGMRSGIQDYSRKETDTFGNFSVTKRGYSDEFDYPVKIPTSQFDFVKRLLAQYRATLILYIGAEDRPETVVYGFFIDFNLIMQNELSSSCNLTVEGVT